MAFRIPPLITLTAISTLAYAVYRIDRDVRVRLSAFDDDLCLTAKAIDDHAITAQAIAGAVRALDKRTQLLMLHKSATAARERLQAHQTAQWHTIRLSDRHQA